MASKGKRKTSARRPIARGALRVVGVGGSAGSLEALEDFFRAQPPTNVAYLVLTHREPRSSSLLAPILRRATRMAVREAVEGARPEPGVVLVVPPHHDVTLRGGELHLSKQTVGGNPIDGLFRALAAAYRDYAVGVLLSGMGDDGAMGLAMIREALGLTLVQAPEAAQFDSMPRAAVNAGVADVVDTAPKLAGTLRALTGRARPPRLAANNDPSLAEILELVRGRTGHDFAEYKKSTLGRRVERRMQLARVTSPAGYVELLRREPAEIERLLSDMLIGVTRFFRDPAVFEGLAKHVLPPLLRDRSPSHPVRIWVAGCATGEEAYSLAILILECAASAGTARAHSVQIYATDLDPAAIERARAGLFTPAIEVDVSPERRARYFVSVDGGYRVRQQVRDMIVFATHNIASDPPFTRLDILSCRNVLIYLEPALQRRLLRLFTYALAPGGYLLLGSSEGVGGFEDALASRFGELKIFHRTAAEVAVDPATFPRTTRRQVESQTPLTSAPARSDLAEDVRRLVLDKVAPAVVALDARGDLLFASKPTGRYFQPPAGRPSVNVFAMAREGLALPLRKVVRKVIAGRGQAMLRNVVYRAGGSAAVVHLAGWPLPGGSEDVDGRVLIAFFDAKFADGPKHDHASPTRSRALRSELREAKASLNAMALEMARSEEALRSVNAALQRANEELQSANEELQSTNEELTTSKEEMQSMNEELLSLNAELQTTNEQLATTNDDMRNLLDSSQIPTLFLDNELRLKRYTAQAKRIAPLIASDVGRPVTDITWSLRYDALATDVAEVLRTLAHKEATVHANDGAVYAMRIHPYRTVDELVDGVVVTFTDVTEYRRPSLPDGPASGGVTAALAVWPGIAYVEDVASGRTIAVSAAAGRLLGHPRAVLEGATRAFWATLRVAPPRGRRRGRASPGIVCLVLAGAKTARYREHSLVLERAADGTPSSVMHVFRRLRPRDDASRANHR